MFLFDETPIFSNPILVRDIGLDEALVLHQLNYWIEVNRKTGKNYHEGRYWICLLYTSPSPRDRQKSRMPSSA